MLYRSAKKGLALTGLLGLLLIINTCNKSNSEPLSPFRETEVTSHEFLWEIKQFGRPASSTLTDVAIINKDNIWAVGIIHTDETDRQDSLGNWVDPYNAIHWDGKEWTLKRIPFNACGAVKYPPINAIFCFSSDNIWFARDGSLTHFDGNMYLNDCHINSFLSGTITGLSGNENNMLYVVGAAGTIVHHNGAEWIKVDSGIQDGINDIYGYWSKDSSEKFKILCATGDAYDTPNGKLLSIEMDLSVEEFNWVNPTVVNSVWLNNTEEIFACGVGVWEYKKSQWRRFEDMPEVLWEQIRGAAANDVFLCGHVGYAAHFNGKNWKSYKLMDNALFKSIAIKDNLVVIVGASGEVVVGKRGTN